jgi:hypothetical protein
MKNKMTDLRNHLFETLEALKDKDQPLDLARAKTISDVAQTIINSAKVEVDLLKAVGAEPSSDFFAGPVPALDRAERLIPRRTAAGCVEAVPARQTGSSG